MELDLETIQTIKQESVKFLIDFGPKILGALIVFFIGKYVINLLMKALDKVLVKYEIDASLSSFLKSFAKAILFVILFITIASTIGVQLTSFIAHREKKVHTNKDVN